MSARVLIAAARAEGLTIVAEGGNLVIETDRDPPAALLAELRQHKAELLAVLSEDDPEERAAIMAEDAGVPRAWVEGFARLDPDRPLGNVPPRRWRAVYRAIGAFLDHWGAEAVRLGWTAEDLFGADADRPEVTWLNSGPLWSGDSARVIELYADRIAFETATGARQTAPKRPLLRPRVLPWDQVPKAATAMYRR
jgi:hypothetical protein